MAFGKINCIIDCRVSDPLQLKGGGLDDQEIAGTKVANERGWNIDKVFRKPHSATTTERDDFEEVLVYIRKRKREGVQIHKYICKTIDRVTRMGAVEYLLLKSKLEELGTELVDTTGIIQPKRNTLEHLGDFKYSWSEYSPSEGGELLAAHEGKEEVRKILTRLVGAEIKLVMDGYAVRRSPDGLKNKEILVDGRKKVVREADPERAVFFQTMFKLRADGLTDDKIVAKVNAMGFRTRAFRRWDREDKEHPRIISKGVGKQLTVKQLQRYILQTEYAGVSYEKWTKKHPVKMKQFNGIVSIEVFNRANRGKIYITENTDGSVQILHNYSPWGKVKRLRDNPNYPWKVILCPECKSPFLGSPSRSKSGKKYPAYHCGGSPKGKRAHPYFRVPKVEFEANISKYLEGLKFEARFLDGLEEKLVKKYREREKEIVLQSSQVSQNVANLKAEQHKKLQAFEEATSPITRRILEEQIEALDVQIKAAEENRGRVEITEKSVKSFIRYAKQVMEHPAEILTSAGDFESRRALLSLFFEEVPTYNEVLNGTPKLQPLFRISEEFKRDKSQLVTPRGIEPRFVP